MIGSYQSAHGLPDFAMRGAANRFDQADADPYNSRLKISTRRKAHGVAFCSTTALPVSRLQCARVVELESSARYPQHQAAPLPVAPGRRRLGWNIDQLTSDT